MRTRKILAALLVFSIALSTLASAEPAGSSQSATPGAAPSAFRTSVDRAAAAAALTGESPMPASYGLAPRKLAQAPQVAAQASNGGGGGMHVTSMILTLVGTVAGVGATVYMLKQMKKVQTPGN
jgi:hypothetical protein